MKPLEGITVLEFSQFMAGPSAGLRMADLGARVIKVERPKTGEGGRQIAIKNLFVQENSLVFHTVNRNKESYAADLKDPEDLKLVKKLITHADVLTHNFRPGVMEKLGLDYESIGLLNPGIIYGVVTGYGTRGPWARRPGQDLLIQSMSGLTHLTGNRDDPPTPMGMAISDIITGAHLVQGILAALVQRGKTKQGMKVSVSLLESTLDLQFEVLTAYLNDRKMVPNRAASGNAHAFLSAPYGIYQTKDHYLAVAMTPLSKLTECIQTRLPHNYHHPQAAFAKRDEIMEVLQQVFITETTEDWLTILEAKGIWCSPVLDYKELINHPGYQVLEMEQQVETSDGKLIKTVRCPIRIDGRSFYSNKAAPTAGQDNKRIEQEFDLNEPLESP